MKTIRNGLTNAMQFGLTYAASSDTRAQDLILNIPFHREDLHHE
jgi:hypothetical protein